jgi:heme-degrading monooxygenase HmoA
MVIHLSIHTPKPGKEQDLIDSMHRFGAAGARQPGFIEAKTLRDARSGRLVGMARWEDEASWRAGVEAMRAAVEDDPFDEWEATDTEGFFLEEV